MEVSFDNLPTEAVSHPLLFSATLVSGTTYNLKPLCLDQCRKNIIDHLTLNNSRTNDSRKIQAIKKAADWEAMTAATGYTDPSTFTP